MKKYLLTGALITITATTLYATTAGSTVVDAMKAAAHAFTLATDLNPGQTGLTSEPVKGKKTGDILTAGEYNRILELVSEGGDTSGGGLQISFKKDYSKDGNSSVPTTEDIGSHDFCALTRYGEGALSDSTAGYCKVEKGTNGIWTVSIQALNNNINCQVTCFTGGVSGTGGSGWVDVPLTDTNPFDKTCEYKFTINTNGDNASIGGTNPVFYAAAVDPFAITYISHLSSTSHILASSKNVYRVNGTAAYTVTKIEKLCGGGGGGSTSATCPSGFVAVGSFCIEPTMSAKGKTWYEAGVACADKGAQLCQWSEWAIACKKGALTDVKFGTTLGVYEWIDDYTGGAYQAIADPRVYSNCEYLSRADPHGGTTPVADIAYRCCSPKQ